MTYEKQRIQELEAFAEQALRKDWLNAQDVSDYLSIIDKAFELNLTKLYKELVEDFCYDETCATIWNMYKVNHQKQYEYAGDK